MRISTNATIDSSLVGTRFEPDIFEVTSELTQRYALAVNDDNPRYLKTDASREIVAPPIFGIVPAMRVLRSAMANGALPLPVSRTVHGEHDIIFVSPIRPGDVLLSSARVCDVKEHSTGTAVKIEIDVSSHNGGAHANQILTAFVRRTENIGSPRKPRIIDNEPAHAIVMKVASDQSMRYAEASFTDGIKLHEDPSAARALGYKTMFLQGQCTMAFAAKAIVDNVADGNPTRLRSMRVRFTHVVYPSDVLTTRVWRTSKRGQYTFDTIKDDGTLALANGLVVVD